MRRRKLQQDLDLRDGCQWGRCRQEEDIIFKGLGLCTRHWKETLKLVLTTHPRRHQMVQEHLNRRARRHYRAAI